MWTLASYTGSVPLWAKLAPAESGDPRTWHSLTDHSADVAAVAEGLMQVPTMATRLVPRVIESERPS